MASSRVPKMRERRRKNHLFLMTCCHLLSMMLARMTWKSHAPTTKINFCLSVFFAFECYYLTILLLLYRNPHPSDGKFMWWEFNYALNKKHLFIIYPVCKAFSVFSFSVELCSTVLPFLKQNKNRMWFLIEGGIEYKYVKGEVYT